MLITRQSQLSGIVRTQDMPVTQEQIDAWQNGMLIQQAMPNLSDDQREFIISGLTPEEWDQLVGEDHEHEGGGDEPAF